MSSNCANCNKCKTKPLNESLASTYSWNAPGGNIDCPECCPADMTPDSRYTKNINLIKPRPNERFCLSDWNHNMDVIDAYISELMQKFNCVCARLDTLAEEINVIQNRKTINDIPSDISTVNISTVDFCRSIIASEKIESNSIYSGLCTITDAPDTSSIQITVRVINGNDICLFANSPTVFPYMWFFHYSKENDVEYISDEWVPVSAKATSSTFGMIKLD